MPDQLIRCLTEDGSFRAIATDTTGLIEELRQRHGTDPTATVALGRLATGTALLGALLKGDQRLALMVEGNGPLQRLHAETDASGNVRASLRVPTCNLPPEGMKFPVAAAIGKAGFLHVIKDLGLKEPYQSMVQLQTSEIAEDLAYYLTSSEQIPSAVALGVLLNTDGSVLAAGGFLVQAMPDCAEDLLATLEDRLHELPPVSNLLAEGATPPDLVRQVFGDWPFNIRQTNEIRFQCGCNLRQIATVLRSLPEEERVALAAHKEPTVINCEYCRQEYTLQPHDLAILDMTTDKKS
ncbi:MAG: Hsp33 family molecular chaperone HslO [Desulfuromonas sp.]|nr:MAG: Hsp33 family molecular chaperone HslO [Desulfuromonas sp.]